MAQQPLLEARQLTKVFVRGSFLSGRSTVRAVDDVSLSIDQGDTFGIVGESGSGKSTLARLVMRLVEPTSGTVRFDGRDLLALDTSALRGMRRHMQLVFQNPYTSLNPRMHVGDIISEPLVIHGCGDARERVARTAEVLAQVGLSHDLMKRLPKELSGGQCQRVGIARALVLNPKLVVLDEPVSALDVSIQAQVVNLLIDLRQQLGLTYLFISHDLRIVAQLCTRIACLYAGRVVEMGPVADVLGNPHHPYTRALVSAVPSGDPDRPRQRISWSAGQWDRSTRLREVSGGHWAAL